jgi:hypothetical protein
VYLKKLVQKYETNKLYVCPYNKRKTNAKGFKDGNLKLYVTQDIKGNEILAEMEKVVIDSSLLDKKEGLKISRKSEKEVRKTILLIQERLDPKKQKKIIEALDVYVEDLLTLRVSIEEKEKEISKIGAKLKQNTKKKENLVVNESLNKTLKALKDEKEQLTQQLNHLKCSFTTKKGKRQIVKSLKLYSKKVSKTGADAIIFPHRREKKIERLSIATFNKALQKKEPFVIKANESTMSVKLFSTAEGQKVGLDYFSGKVNPHIGTKVNPKYTELVKYSTDILTLYKNDIIKVNNIKTGVIEYFIFNGGGNISDTNTSANNKVTIKNINLNVFKKKSKNGMIKELKEDNVTPGKTTIISKVKIDFFGNIEEV